jgi:cell division protein FtsL
VFAKLVVLIVALAACACGLLCLRQMRTQAAHELAEARLRVLQRDNEFWRLRSRIAAKVTPEHVEQLAGRLMPLKPVGPDQHPGALAGPVEEPRR